MTLSLQEPASKLKQLKDEQSSGHHLHYHRALRGQRGLGEGLNENKALQKLYLTGNHIGNVPCTAVLSEELDAPPQSRSL